MGSLGGCGFFSPESPQNMEYCRTFFTSGFDFGRLHWALPLGASSWAGHHFRLAYFIRLSFQPFTVNALCIMKSLTLGLGFFGGGFLPLAGCLFG